MKYTINEINTLQYMGCKSRIIKEISNLIFENANINTVVDLFAGTGTIGYALKPYYTIYSNDIELYSYIINEAILNGCILSNEEQEKIIFRVNNLYENIRKRFSSAIKKEEEYLDYQSQNYLEYSKFCEDTPSVINPVTNDKDMTCILDYVKRINMGSENQNIDIPVLFLTYYANAYFGVNQCCEIDTVRAIIEEVKDYRIKYVLLAALMSVMSVTASTTTHFAQYLKVNSQSSYKNIASKRKCSIIKLFIEKLDSLRSEGILNNELGVHKCTNMNYIECLNSISLNNKTLVYADPPYFKEHYSRYYHILNTLCLYDYPKISINNQTKQYTVGRYREERNVSDFGKKSTALQAFEELIDICYKNQCYLMISYSDNSIINIDEIMKRMNNKFHVKLQKIPLRHSSQGRNVNTYVEEYIIIGKPLDNCDLIGQKKVSNLLEEISKMKPISDNPASFIHNYMARKPYNIISKIISELTPEKGMVYDPMFGSGTTLIEASKLGRNAVGTDINDLAYKLAKVSLRNWNISKVETLSEEFVKRVESECRKYYLYEHNNETRIIERCHFNKIDDEIIPTKYWYKIITDKGLSSRKMDDVTEEFSNEYKQLKHIKIENIKDEYLIPNSRIAIKDGASVYSYFCNRNLVVLDKILLILKEYSNYYGYDVLEIMVSSTLNLIRLSDKKASSQMPYWLPKQDLTSRNALFILRDKKNKIIEGLKYLQEQCKCNIVEKYDDLLCEKGVIIRNIPAQKISDNIMPKESIDLILTDPPYTDQVPYLEYSQLWSNIFKWQSHKPNIMKEELVVSNAPSRKKDAVDFDNLFELIIKKTCEYLKKDGYFAMFYHSFDLKSWASIIDLMEKYNLTYQGEAPIKAPRKSFKTVLSPKKNLDGNYLVIFKKGNVSKRVFSGTINEAKEEVINCTRKILATRIEVTSQDLYDYGLLRDSIEKGYLKMLSCQYKTFIDVIVDDFKYVNGYWEEQ